MNRLNNVHPGEVLLHEFMEPLNITPYRLAKAIGVQQSRIEAILDGKCGLRGHGDSAWAVLPRDAAVLAQPPADVRPGGAE